MVYILNIRNANRNYDRNLAIVRSLKSKPDFVEQESLLSPSTDLFHKYLALRDAGQWNRDSFENVYVPQFLKELKANRAALDKLNEIFYDSEKKKLDIALMCFCQDETLCHRSIIAGLLQGVNCKVTASQDYSKYFKIFETL